MTTPGLPPLFGAPWERQEQEGFSRSRSDEFFAGLKSEGLEWGAKKLILWVPGIDREVARSFATAISVMESRGQTRVASDLFAGALRIS